MDYFFPFFPFFAAGFLTAFLAGFLVAIGMGLFDRTVQIIDFFF